MTIAIDLIAKLGFYKFNCDIRKNYCFMIKEKEIIFIKLATTIMELILVIMVISPSLALVHSNMIMARCRTIAF